MKKYIIYIISAFAAFLAVPFYSSGENPVPVTHISKEERNAQNQAIVHRLNQIDAIDKSTLSKEEKKELRKEVLAIRDRLKTNDNGGVYLSVGAIIVILLVLIIVF